MYPCVRESYLKNGYKSDKTKRGSDKFVRVTWGTAYDLIANELKRVYKNYGSDAVYGGSYGWFVLEVLTTHKHFLVEMLGVAGGYTSRTCTYSTHAIRQITPYVTGTDESTALVEVSSRVILMVALLERFPQTFQKGFSLFLRPLARKRYF